MPSVSNNVVNYSDGAAPKGDEVGEEVGGGGVKNSSQKERDRPHAPVANILEHDDKRPHAPVAKILENENQQTNNNSDNKQQQQLPQSGSDDNNKSSNGSSKIPNLLNSGAFPPPPHSPHRHSHDSLSSPPTIIASPNLTSPHIPAAPPTTPYTPSIPFPTADNLIMTSSSSLPTVPMQFPPSSNSPPLNSHSSSLPTNDASTTSSSSTIISTLLNQQPLDPHYNHLLHQSLLQTQSHEQHRIQQQTHHETQNYTTIDEYRHALSRERRHSLTLSLELTYYKFLSKYQSCSLHSNLEMNEEARLNKLIKNIDCMKKDMKEDKVRCVMELEREEEGIVNGLMGRLEDVRREKMLLERQVYSGTGGSGVGGFESTMMQQHQGRQIPTLVGQLDRMQVGSTTTTNNDAGNGQQDLSVVQQQQSPSTARSVPSAVDVFPCLKESDDGGDEIDNEDDEEEEEEEDSNDEDILEGHHHDAEMEEELEKILKLKESKK